jgi:pyridoxine 5-phosphate synthase
MTHLSVNLNAIAQLRNRRSVPWPSVVGMARLALDAGADGITVHPRPDERHIRRTDVFDLAALLARDYPGREFNIEGYPSEEFLLLCERVSPDQVTLVPDEPGQATSDHGWDVAANRDLLTRVIERLQAGGMRVSLFIDADPLAPERAASVGADCVELYTGPYGAALEKEPADKELLLLQATADAARELGPNHLGGRPGLLVNAGHDLNLINLPPLKRAVPDLAEVSIGHAVTADALIFGMAETVRKYKAVCAG